MLKDSYKEFLSSNHEDTMTFKRKLMDALTALNEVAELKPDECMNCDQITYLIVFSAGVGAGGLQAEIAHESGYAGTWAADGAAVTFAASAVKVINSTVVAPVKRIRISTLVTGGTVTVWAVGR
jgi:hypothetical protein